MTTAHLSPLQRLARGRLPQSAAAGIGYYLWLRARWGMGLMVLLIVAGGVLVRHHPARIAPDVIVAVCGFLLLYSAIFLVSVFAFANFKKALGKNDTVFPMHMMTLPVRTRGLVGLPMLMGAIMLSIFWVAFERLILVKTGTKPQPLWALLTIVGVVVWLQATAWLPYWFSMLRIIVVSVSGFVVFTAVATAVFMCRVWDWSEPLCIAAICVMMLAAFPVALLGVAKIRRGEVGTAPWLNRRSRLGQAAPMLRPFTSLRRAQFWFELRRNVPTGPVAAAGVALVLCLAALGARTEVTGIFGFEMHWSTVLYVSALISPWLITGWHGVAMARSDIWSSDIAMHPFIAIRPMTCNQIVKLKLRAAVVSIAFSFGAALLIVGIFSLGRNSFVHGQSFAAHVMEFASRRHVLQWAGLAALILISSWRQIAQAIYLPMYGRAYASYVLNVLSFLGLMTIVGLIYWSMDHARLRHFLIAAVPWVVIGIVALKVIAAAFVLRASRRIGFLRREEILLIAMAWFALSAAILAILLSLRWTRTAPLKTLIAGAIALVPVVRLALAPLALNANRHR